MIRRLLIANRGEIAIRVIRACREMGISTVAVYSEADVEAPHVLAADFGVGIGPAPASESYLNVPAILEAARRTGADAVHPGYGFLSENAAFARACEDAGLTFVGPPGDVIAGMGSKAGARAVVSAAGVPVVPGATPDDQTDAGVGAALTRVGLPALLKAAAGGGGKGMRIVRDEDDLDEAIGAARRESTRAFGNGTLYVERLVEHARHIEVQILADTHGHIVHLFERDCTLQRRHQKVIEEAPASGLSPKLRERITRAAVDAARAVGYINAGTVEFLVEGDGDDARFYFLEMNTRLQVEHPVTEAVTGLDLVQAQLRVAQGEPLPFAQEDISLRGHAIECRVYAEDPAQDFLPQAGRLLRYREPAGPGIRVDSGVREGQDITVHYDPMIAKVIASGQSRQAAIARVAEALKTFDILGVRHNIPFLLALLADPNFVTGQTHTRYIEEHLAALAPEPSPEDANMAAALAAVLASRGSGPAPVDRDAPPEADPWQTLGPVKW